MLYQLLGATYVFMSHEVCRWKNRPLMFMADESQFVVMELIDWATGREDTWEFNTGRCWDCEEWFVPADMHSDCVCCLGRKCKPCFGNRRDGNGSRVCRDCMDQHYHACSSCGGMYHEEDMVYVQDQGGTCTGCMPSDSEDAATNE